MIRFCRLFTRPEYVRDTAGLQSRIPFSDEASVLARGGSGGNGCRLYRHIETSSGLPIPRGMNGADGGDVIAVANPSIRSLYGIRGVCLGRDGTNGVLNRRHKSPKKTYLYVPVGTKIYDEGPKDPERITKKQPSVTSRWQEPVTLGKQGDSVVLAYGGKGGKGNVIYEHNRTVFTKKRSVNCIPADTKVLQIGYFGENRLLRLELKYLADIGLIGLPNAGKSSLVNCLSNAKSLVAPYPFTTLYPCLGTLKFADYTSVSIADIPGIISGAHRDVGLGLSFLKHIERSKMLIFVIDVSRDPILHLRSLINELECYQPGLSQKPSLVVANKADLLPPPPNNLTELIEFIKTNQPREWSLVPFSAKYKLNLPALLLQIRAMVDVHCKIERVVRDKYIFTKYSP